MDGLIIILIIIGIVSRIGKRKKQQEETLKKFRRDNAFAEAFDETEKAAEQVKKVPEPAKKAAAVQKAAAPVAKAIQQEIPFTKEEWTEFLEGIAPEKKQPKVKARPVSAAAMVSPEGRASLKQPLPEGYSPALKSTQGESEKEHRRHRERIEAEEKRQREQAESLRSMRQVNRQKLREAVIMSEVLGKPVALRGRKV